MFEESPILAAMNSWFTPTVLFVLLNVMIGTILFTSNIASTTTATAANHPDHHREKQPQTQQSDPRLNRSPSVLQRLRSLNLYSFRSQESPSNPAKQIPDSDHRFPLQNYVFDQTGHHDVAGVEEPPNPQTHQQMSAAMEAHHYAFNEIQHQNIETHLLQPHQHLERNLEISATRFDYQLQQQEQNLEMLGNHYDFDLAHEHEDVDAEGSFETHEGYEEEIGPNVVDEEDEEEGPSLDEIYSQLTGRHVDRTVSDTKPASGELPVRLPAKMKKSASMKSAFSHFEEEKIVEARRPATVRERVPAAEENDDVEVDAKADDFINKFKQQLKLQRIDSIIRYKDMTRKGTSK